MPHTCFIIGCKSRSGKGNELSFFRVPKPRATSTLVAGRTESTDQQRAKWIERSRRNDMFGTKLVNARICSRHFVSGKPAAATDTANVDWAPTLHLGYDIKATEKSKKVKAITKEEPQEVGKNNTKEEAHIDVEETTVVNLEEEQLDLENHTGPEAPHSVQTTSVQVKNEPVVQSSLLVEHVERKPRKPDKENSVIDKSGKEHTSEESYVIRVEIMDGTSQLVHLTLEQAMALGVHNINAEKEFAAQKQPAMLNYQIIQPHDLNLCSKEGDNSKVKEAVTTSLPRGRPKKRPSEESSPNDLNDTRPSKIVNTSRTRSGRITKPPIHMERHYEKIITNIKPSLEPIKEVHTVRFEPLKTTNKPTEVPHLVHLNVNPKKRNIPAHYKCPACKKVYLGRNRMASHFRKFPSHSAGTSGLMTDCNTWYFLIETALKANRGKRGEKLCKELANLVRNVRIMAKNFLKPATAEKSDYVVDATLAYILKIDEGHYKFNENGICKDVNIFSFLLDGDGMGHESDVSDVSTETSYSDGASVNTSKEREVLSAPSLISQEHTYVQTKRPEINLHFDSIINLDLDKSTKSGVVIDVDESSESSENITIISIFDEGCDEEESADATNAQSVEKNVQEKRAKGDQRTEVDKKTRKSDEFDLHKLHLDEFLPDASGNTLDTSAGSDDIMNVDQFVNERFQNLTEPPDVTNPQDVLTMPLLHNFNFNT